MEKKEILEIIKELSLKRAPSGLEKERGKIFKKEIEKLCKHKDFTVEKDKLGNYFVKLKGTTPKQKIAILAHLDEIGGTIRRIKKDGKMEFSKRGGYEGRWLISKEVQILNINGDWINGVICGRSAHATPEKLRIPEKIDPLELEIYCGAKNAAEVKEKYKIHIGSPLVFFGKLDLLNPKYDDNIIAGYSMDNLTALTCLVLLTKKLIDEFMNEYGELKLKSDIYIVATTREEIGTEGAYYFLKNNPIDKVIGIDIGLVEDIASTIHSDLNLDGGPVIVWQEGRGSGILDYDFCKSLVLTAEKNNIKFQNGVFEFYGSDAGKAQKWHGVPSALIGIPTKFSHNVPEISTLDAIKDTAELIFQYLKNL